MPESCVPMYLCGTETTGWLNGKHPTVQEGVVSRQVCFHHGYDCCWRPKNIRIRNCGGFYVYELKDVPFCPSRYCGGTFDPSNLTSRLIMFSSFLHFFGFFFQKLELVVQFIYSILIMTTLPQATLLWPADREGWRAKKFPSPPQSLPVGC